MAVKITKKAVKPSVVAPHGDKMIEVRAKFWTNGIAADKGKIAPGECWASGVVYLTPNSSHGIKSGANGVHFHTLAGAGVAIEEILRQAGIVVHSVKEEVSRA
jgi:hypothetical protein